MNIITIDGELWRFSRPDDLRPTIGISLYDVIIGIRQRYQFVGFPTAIPQSGQGLVFQEGTFRTPEKSVQIKKLEIYPDGIHITVASYTDDADALWADLQQWVVSIGGRSDAKASVEYHVSTIVCEFENDIGNLIKDVSEIASMVSSKLDIPTDVRPQIISFIGEPLGIGSSKLSPSLFRIEPRVDTVASEHRYFSVANMTTANHVGMLEWLDKRVHKSN